MSIPEISSTRLLCKAQLSLKFKDQASFEDNIISLVQHLISDNEELKSRLASSEEAVGKLTKLVHVSRSQSQRRQPKRRRK